MSFLITILNCEHKEVCCVCLNVFLSACINVRGLSVNTMAWLEVKLLINCFWTSFLQKKPNIFMVYSNSIGSHG